MKVLVTGAAGFIGFSLCQKLLKKKISVVGIDNFNDYYDKNLKINRYKELKKINKKFKIFNTNLENCNKIKKIFSQYKFNFVYHFAAQAGVRFSISNPDSYFNSNLLGFYNVLKCSNLNKVQHLIIASSSSVYGKNSFGASEKTVTDYPLQFYAATKKSNEIMAYSFSNIYKLPITAIRFFTIYGPWGRPDMSLFKFVDAIINKKTIYLYNKGNHHRDYTYIEDILKPLINLTKILPKKSTTPFQVFNLGNGKSIYLKKFYNELIKQIGKKTKLKLLKQQKGDAHRTLSINNKAKKILGFKSNTNYKLGIKKFLKWYLNYYKK